MRRLALILPMSFLQEGELGLIFGSKCFRDIFKSPCPLVNAQEGAAYGAAMLAAVGIKVKNSVEEVSMEWIEETKRISPGADKQILRKCILITLSYILH